MNIWQKLKRPVFILAPMEDVTDTVFRRVISKCGRPDLYFTEFTNVDGMFSKGESYVGQRLLYTKEEKPLIAQIWGLQPTNFYKAAKRLAKDGFDGIDLNMGCPQKDVTKKGACAALINNHSLAKEIIQATQEGAGKLPVSVKTRIGFNTIVLEDWISFLLDQNLAALTVHLRTAKEMSAVPAHWDLAGNVVKIRDEREKKLYSSSELSESRSLKKNSSRQVFDREAQIFDSEITLTRGTESARTINHTLIIGNGDIKSLSEAKEKIKKYNLDGIMIGRGVFNNPWLFNGKIDIAKVSLKKRLDLLLYHLTLWEETWGPKKNFQVLKKYFKIYISGFDGAADIRIKLMETNSSEEVKQVLGSLSLNS